MGSIPPNHRPRGGWLRVWPPLAMAAALAAALPAAAESQADCQKRWLLAEENNIVRMMGAVDGVMTIVVDEGLWPIMDYETKVGILKTYECAVAGPGFGLTEVNVRGHRSNRVVGEWRWNKLEVK